MSPRWIAAGLFAVMVIALSESAEAQDMDTTWRQHRSDKTFHSPTNFAFELRFGPYYPQIDDEFAGTGPYEKVFDNDPQFYFGVEFDWLPLRIPYLGMFGPGIGWGYTAASATAKISGTGEDSGDETSLTIMPMHLSAVLRADELMRRTDIPIVPYGKLGLGLATWDSGTASGTSEVGGVAASDTTWGVHTALGAMVSLNWIEPRRAQQMDEEGGVNHVYIFGEWMNAMLNGLGSRPQMRVGTSTIIVGLAVDM